MSTFIHDFKIRYLIVLCVILVEILFAQGLVQQSLFQERVTRESSALAKGLTTRELYMSINARDIEIDPTNRLTYIKNIKKVYVQWQQWEQEVYIPTYSSNATVQGYLHKAIPSYNALKVQFGIILRVDSGKKAIDITPELRTMIVPDNTYLIDLYEAYSTINNDADHYIIVVQWIEIGVCALTLLTLAYESLLAIFPALRELSTSLAQHETVSGGRNAIS